MIGAEDCHCQECSALAEYITSSTDPLSNIIKESAPRERGLLSFTTEPKKATEDIDNKNLDNLLKMELHGNYFKNRNAIPTLSSQKFGNWLNAPFMRFKTEKATMCSTGTIPTYKPRT